MNATCIILHPNPEVAILSLKEETEAQRLSGLPKVTWLVRGCSGVQPWSLLAPRVLSPPAGRWRGEGEQS